VTLSTGVLLASIALGVLYGVAFCWRPHSLLKLIVKTGSTALLALWAYLLGGPVLLVAGLALSALGDFFLEADENDKFLLPGMAAFFAAHVAYIALFWALPQADRTLLILAAQIGLIACGVVFIRWLAPWVTKDMRFPVIGYGAIILMMGAAALRLDPTYLPVLLGALMFIASDVILSFQLFVRPADAPKRALPSIALWFLYYGGQALIAWGVLRNLA
tara:strand:- start:5010 stop:5663 length:654 start_codon:yes stop_codon:yes gene_type:complete